MPEPVGVVIVIDASAWMDSNNCAVSAFALIWATKSTSKVHLSVGERERERDRAGVRERVGENLKHRHTYSKTPSPSLSLTTVRDGEQSCNGSHC